MEEETSSSISNAKANINAEAFDSSSCSSWSHQAAMPSETEGHVSTPKFKGVVSHANGHWGAQIYAKHQRVWLGTFKTEKEAAMAYDSAAIRLRNGDSHRNFPWTSANDQEQNFQSQYTTEAILNMIKDGSYLSKFTDFLTSQWMKKEFDPDMLRVHGSGSGNDNEGLCYKLLFQKELTPSDVGKLNRLVIPKKHAIKYFPRISGNPKENTAEGNNDDGQLVFYDREMKSWKFRYCYWKSSQSFVFTKGWNRFVRENNLKENDIVAFYTCEVPKEGQPFCIIDVVHKGNSSNAALQAADIFPGTGDYMEEEEEENNQCEDLGSTNMMEKKGFRLFGVQIT